MGLRRDSRSPCLPPPLRSAADIPCTCRSRRKAPEGALPDEQDELPRQAFHDLRRKVRTRLLGLGVPDVMAELVIGHRQ